MSESRMRRMNKRGTIAVLQVFVSWVTYRFPRSRPILEGEPIVVLQDGKVIERNLERERLTIDEIAEEARKQQIAHLAEVRFAILENDCEGGETHFPYIKAISPQDRRPRSPEPGGNGEVPWREHEDGGLAFLPIKGNAIFWVNLHANFTGDRRVMHSGLPVRSVFRKSGYRFCDQNTPQFSQGFLVSPLPSSHV